MQASKLSEVMRGLCGLSRDSATRISKALRLDAKETEYFVSLVEAQHGRSKITKTSAQKIVQKLRTTAYNELSLDRYALISDWHHFAILELTEIPGAAKSAKKIAKRLGLTELKIQEAIDRLKRLGLLIEKSQRHNSYAQTAFDLASPSDTPSRHIREHHKQILSRAMLQLDTIPVLEREYSSTLFAVDSSKILEAKKALKDFRRKFCKNLEQSSAKDRLYCFSMQLFPLDEVPTNNEENLK